MGSSSPRPPASGRGGSKRASATTDRPSLSPGDRIEVRSRFDGHWARGFEVAAVVGTDIRVRRLSDGSVLPAVFTADEVRSERRRSGMWWY